jgi:hypothetical protein
MQATIGRRGRKRASQRDLNMHDAAPEQTMHFTRVDLFRWQESTRAVTVTAPKGMWMMLPAQQADRRVNRAFLTRYIPLCFTYYLRAPYERTKARPTIEQPPHRLSVHLPACSDHWPVLQCLAACMRPNLGDANREPWLHPMTDLDLATVLCAAHTHVVVSDASQRRRKFLVATDFLRCLQSAVTSYYTMPRCSGNSTT